MLTHHRLEKCVGLQGARSQEEGEGRGSGAESALGRDSGITAALLLGPDEAHEEPGGQPAAMRTGTGPRRATETPWWGKAGSGGKWGACRWTVGTVATERAVTTHCGHEGTWVQRQKSCQGFKSKQEFEFLCSIS